MRAPEEVHIASGVSEGAVDRVKPVEAGEGPRELSMAVGKRLEGVDGRFWKHGVGETCELTHVRADVEDRSDLQAFQPGAVEPPVLIVVDSVPPDPDGVRVAEREESSPEDGV